MKVLSKFPFAVITIILGMLSAPVFADDCPTGGVISSTNAYFGSSNRANTCSDEGQECSSTYFFEQSEYSTAICSSGTWVNMALQSSNATVPTTSIQPLDTNSSVSSACPTGGVIDSSRAYIGQTLGDNACGDEGKTCDTIYFYEDAGYSTARCDSGKWVNAATTPVTTSPSTTTPSTTTPSTTTPSTTTPSTTTPATPASDVCPDGGVLVDGRAYFNGSLEQNTCATEGNTCNTVYFYSASEFLTAVCSAGTWVPEGSQSTTTTTPTEPTAPATVASCPEYVFQNGEIYDDGAYLENSCSADSSVRCDDVYFYELPDGGYGFRNAACVAGAWAPESQLANVDAFRLRPVVNESELAEFFKAGLRQTYGSISLVPASSPIGPAPPTAPTGPTGPAPSAPSGASSAPTTSTSSGAGGATPTDVSGTNVQELGVDEEDRIKSDGEYLYVLADGRSLREDAPVNTFGTVNRVRILSIDAQTPDAAVATAGGLDFEVDLASGQQTQGLYLSEDSDQLVVTANGGGFNGGGFIGFSSWYNPYAWRNRSLSIANVDVSNPNAPKQIGRLDIDGEIISTRRIDDTLYIASRYQPSVPNLVPYAPLGASAGAALSIIDNVQARQLLPTYTTSPGGASQPLVEPGDCFIPTEDAPQKSADVITITAIDISAFSVVDSKCYVGTSETLYASLNAIYVATTRYEYEVYTDNLGRQRTRYSNPTVETDLHKFELGQGSINYTASGIVEGHLGWNIDRKPYRMSEDGDDLRVVTMTRELTPTESPVTVTVLRDNGSDQLSVLSTLPNASRPEPIGKPGEELYGSRFVGDRLYIVTFRVIDPLYIVDLSDPQDTFVAGELEIEGYSDYLHPLPNGLLIGLGKNAIPDDRGDDFRGAWYQGVKLSLFDVSQPSNPVELNAIEIGKRGTNTTALLNPRAFTFLPQRGDRPARVALGMDVNDIVPWYIRGEPSVSTFYQWGHSGLYLFEVDVNAASPEIRNTGAMIVNEAQLNAEGRPENFQLYGQDRSLIADDAVFYVHGDDVYASKWTAPEEFIGPK